MSILTFNMREKRQRKGDNQKLNRKKLRHRYRKINVLGKGSREK